MKDKYSFRVMVAPYVFATISTKDAIEIVKAVRISAQNYSSESPGCTVVEALMYEKNAAGQSNSGWLVMAEEAVEFHSLNNIKNIDIYISFDECTALRMACLDYAALYLDDLISMAQMDVLKKFDEILAKCASLMLRQKMASESINPLFVNSEKQGARHE